jgi:phenylalanine-4-hydroxylase
MMTQQQVIDSLPSHLRPFVATQNYQSYTARDHAAWRFLLSELTNTLSTSAHPVYLEGLTRTGISLERIPRIEEMNECLQELGWRAVVVDGFLPPAIFMEFQAHRVLVVAVDMRSIGHMLYTPAPDIVHESAGHAPFIVDIDYAEYLQRFGELGMRAIASEADMSVYQAIRQLSIVKESPTSSMDELAAAEAELQAANAANTEPSEAALLARLHWWTVEYGLVGSVNDYKIFGAGLLSSLGESVNCLNDEKVTKKLLTVDAVNDSYDITCEQTQLFVAKDCRHLSQVLEEFARHMCVSQGGAHSLEKAINAATVNTAVTDSGLEISGRFSRLLKDAVGNPIYLNTTGPTQLSFCGRQLKGHGTDFHSAGFGSPIGRLQSMSRGLAFYTIDELKAHGIAMGEEVTLSFLSGVTVKGLLKTIHRREQKNILFTFEDCTVLSLTGEILFDPAWGIFDMAVGDSVDSVYGGTADQETYPLYEAIDSTPEKENTESDAALMACFEQVRNLRSCNQPDEDVFMALLETASSFPESNWLLKFELLELAETWSVAPSACEALQGELLKCAEKNEGDESRLIRYGLDRLAAQGKH